MNCLEVRRKVLVEPDCRDPALRSHLNGCSGCREFVRQQQHREARLQRALEVPVPAGLAARTLLRQSLLRNQQQRRTRWQALAAGLVLLLAGLAGRHVLQPVEALDVVILAHINQELEHLHEQQSVNLDSLNHLLRPWGMELPALPARLSYAGVCPVGRARAVHLVVNIRNQPVTLLLLPEERISAPQRVRDARFVGEILPFGAGSIAIVGESEAVVKQVEHRLATLVPEYL
jgi:hypothetical protein